jgi:hypothetical protein
VFSLETTTGKRLMKPFMYSVTVDSFQFCLCTNSLYISCMASKNRVHCILFSNLVNILLTEIMVFLVGWLGL